MTDYQTVLKEHPNLLDEHQVLDHGSVKLITWGGSDKLIVDAARTSYQGGTKSVREDADLIDYLLRHSHWSPFEMVNFTFYIRVPLFIAQQLLRHRTAKLNQESARYSVMEDVFFTPDVLRTQSKTNKQGSEGQIVGHSAAAMKEAIQDNQERAYSLYLAMIESGVARELARTVLPQSLYTRMYWQSDLRNLFNLLKQRLDPHAQHEIQVYAQPMFEIIKAIAPAATAAFEEHVLYGTTFSRTDMALFKEILESLDEPAALLNAGGKHHGLKKSRRRELLAKLGYKLPPEPVAALPAPE